MAEFKNTVKPPLKVAPPPAPDISVPAAAAVAPTGGYASSSVRKSYLPFLLLALLLVVIGGSVYYFGLKNTAPSTPVPVAITNQPTMTPTPTPTTAPVSVQDLQNAANSINISTDSADLTDLNKDIQGL